MDQESHGFLRLSITGKGAKEAFAQEAGGHRWQRVPPTERQGRVHSSTVTVAVIDGSQQQKFVLDERDLEIISVRGSGPGGQHRNKTESGVQITHRPTGMRVRADKERHQLANKHAAMALLQERLAGGMVSQHLANQNDDRRQQIGSGERGDKVRTIQVQNDNVRDHRTGRSITVRAWMKGDLEGLLR